MTTRKAGPKADHAPADSSDSDWLVLSRLHDLAYNPRQISDSALSAIAFAIKRFSPSSPHRLQSSITVNRNGNRIIGGHQRVRALRELLGQDCIHKDDITWVDHEPDSAAEKALNLSLNNPAMQGVFTDAVGPLIDEIKVADPELWSEARLFDIERQAIIQDPLEVDPVAGDPGGQQPEHDPSPQPFEQYNYVMILFRDIRDWTVARQLLALKPVYDPKRGDRSVVGTGLVLEGADFLRRFGPPQ